MCYLHVALDRKFPKGTMEGPLSSKQQTELRAGNTQATLTWTVDAGPDVTVPGDLVIYRGHGCPIYFKIFVKTLKTVLSKCYKRVQKSENSNDYFSPL